MSLNESCQRAESVRDECNACCFEWQVVGIPCVSPRSKSHRLSAALHVWPSLLEQVMCLFLSHPLLDLVRGTCSFLTLHVKRNPATKTTMRSEIGSAQYRQPAADKMMVLVYEPNVLAASVESSGTLGMQNRRTNMVQTFSLLTSARTTVSLQIVDTSHTSLSLLLRLLVFGATWPVSFFFFSKCHMLKCNVSYVFLLSLLGRPYSC